MPVIPPTSVPPYDDIETILNFARVIANDCGISLAGNLLSDAQPYTMTMLVMSWRKLQARLANNSIEEFPQEIIITSIPAQLPPALQDPAIQSSLSYGGYNDGNSIYNNFLLPSDLEIPIRLWERVTGQNGDFIPMQPAIDGLPTRPKYGLLRDWEWRDDAIYFLGSSQSIDLRIRYKRILSDPILPTTEVIPLIRCAIALAYLIVEIFASSRGSTVLPVFQAEKEEAIKQIINTTTRKKQRTNFRRIPYSRRGRYQF
jgi:hypothetical protein